MSAVGNGSLTKIDFSPNKILPNTTITATSLMPDKYQSNLVGGKGSRLRRNRRIRPSGSIRSRRSIEHYYGGSKKYRKTKRVRILRKTRKNR